MPPFQLSMPTMHRISQSFDAERLDSMDDVLAHTMNGAGIEIPHGKEIAITAGSRGIANVEAILHCIVQWVKQNGGIPFLVPAMGSHGGATAEGQIQILAELGITEQSMGCDIRSDMTPVFLPQEDCPLPVCVDRNAHAAFGTIVVNRIKPHTAFHGRYESGLVKMMSIGLGKHKQALAIHGEGTKGFLEVMPQVAKQVLKHGNVLMGIGIVENAYDETCHVEALPADRILEEEPRLLELARANMPSLPLDDIDILIVDRMGKNLSGTGMDGNIINRLGVASVPDRDTPRIGTIVVRDLTPESHGNALGVGLADITTRRLFEQINFAPMYENLFTSTYLPRGKIPVICETDWESIAFAARCTTGKTDAELKILRIDSTLHVEHLHASQAALDVLTHNPRITVERSLPEAYFDSEGYMVEL